MDENDAELYERTWLEVGAATPDWIDQVYDEMIWRNEANDAEWYDQNWQEVGANPDWTDQQVYDEMTWRITEANGANLEAMQRNASNDEDAQYIIAPNNPVFIDVEISDQDIRNGYTLQDNPNGIKWRVNAAGIPHPDDLSRFFEQQEILQTYSDNLAAKFSMILGTTVAENAVEVVSTRLSQGSRKDVPYDSQITINTDVLSRGNGIPPNSGGYKKVSYLLNTDSLVPRPCYEGAIIHTHDGFFKVIKRGDSYEDWYIDPPPKDTIYWDQDINDPSLGRNKIAGYADTQSWGFLGGASIISRVGKAAEEIRVVAKAASPVSKTLWGSWADYEKVVVNIEGGTQTYAKVGDRLYSKHAVDRMQPSGNRFGHPITQAGGDYGRSVSPEHVEEVLRTAQPILQGNGNLSYVLGSIEVITNNMGAVITIITK